MDKYRKLIAALAGAVVEGIALWADAPHWLLSLVPLLTALAVYQVPNAEAK
jgi:hypothetical protein